MQPPNPSETPMRKLTERGAIDFAECTTCSYREDRSGKRRFYGCRCGKCAACGLHKHIGIHGPLYGNPPGSKPFGHEFVPVEQKAKGGEQVSIQRYGGMLFSDGQLGRMVDGPYVLHSDHLAEVERAVAGAVRNDPVRRQLTGLVAEQRQTLSDLVTQLAAKETEIARLNEIIRRLTDEC